MRHCSNDFGGLSLTPAVFSSVGVASTKIIADHYIQFYINVVFQENLDISTHNYNQICKTMILFSSTLSQSACVY